MLDHQLETWSDLAIIHLIDGLLGALRSVLLVGTLWVIKADESELAYLVLLHDEGFDVSEWLEHLGDLFLGLVSRNVLHIDVVDESSERSAILWLELHGQDTILALSLKSNCGALLLLEANEAVASGRKVWVEGNFQTLDLAHWLKEVVEILMLHVLWDLAENVVILQLLLVASKQLLVESKGTAWLLVDLEVSHLVASIVELLGVLDTDHGRAELSGDVSLDLRLGVEDNSGFLLEDVGNLVAGDVVSGKVVQVNKLLWIHGIFCLFVFECKVCFVFLFFNEYAKRVFLFFEL